MKLFLISFMFLVVSGESGAKSILQADIADFNSIFIAAADSSGPAAIDCGKPELREEMINEVEFLLAGYIKLHKGFPKSNTPIREQIYKRNKIVCEIIGCDDRSAEKFCSNAKDKETGRPYEMWSFDYAVKKMRARLTKAGIDPDSVLTQEVSSRNDSRSCGNRAQYYQDAYQQSGRVDDLICMKKALERELK